jgi:hypothetical protein
LQIILLCLNLDFDKRGFVSKMNVWLWFINY